MNIPTSLALVALAIQFATAAMLFSMARAPGWERVRIFGLAAFSAGLYSSIDVWAVLAPRSADAAAMVVRVNLTIAAAHAAAWVWYTFADERGRFSSMAPRMRWLAVGTVGCVGLLSMTGVVVDATVIRHMPAP